MSKKRIIERLLLLLPLLFVFFSVDNAEAKDWQSIYNGYTDHWGNFVPGYIDNDTWMTPAPTYMTGNLVFYGPYAMDATAEYREIDYEEKGCIGGISLMSPIDIGKKAWIEVDGSWHGPFCVVDCARRGDMYSIIVYRDEVVEVNFDFALELGMVSPAKENGSYEVYEWRKNDVIVYVQNCNGGYPNKLSQRYRNPVDYSDWFLENLSFALFEENVPYPRDGYMYWQTANREDVFVDFRKFVPCEIVRFKDG